MKSTGKRVTDRHKVIWRYRNKRAKETLGPYQDLEFLVKGVEVGGGTPTSRLTQRQDEAEGTITKKRVKFAFLNPIP